VEPCFFSLRGGIPGRRFCNRINLDEYSEEILQRDGGISGLG